MATLRPEEHRKRQAEAEGWPIGVTSYRLGSTWICHVDNVSPGAIVARGSGASRDEAENAALDVATRRLRATRRMQETLEEMRASVSSLEASVPTTKR
jgi:hypothetical protein